MDTLLTWLAAVGPQHWLVLGLVLLIAELATGTTYLLWPAVAAFVVALLAWFAPTGWTIELGVFAALVVALTFFGQPLVKQWRNEGAASKLNDRAASLVGARGVIENFSNGAGSVKVGDTIWRARGEGALGVGEAVVVTGVDGTTLRVRKA